MSGAPAVLIPRGLQQVHPQLEPAFKSIAGAIARLHSTAAAAASSPGLAASVASLEQEIEQLQAEVAAIGTGGAGYTAGSPIPAYGVVREVSAGVVGLADSSSLATAYGVAGVATAAAGTGKAVPLARDGETVTNASWAWTPGPVFLGAAGGLTQSAPAVPVLVGHAISATSVLVSVDGPYLPLLRSGSDPAGYLLYINNSDGTLRYSSGSAWIRLGTLDQISTAVATVNLGGQTLTDIANAVDPTDAVNLQTLTSYLANLSSREACAYATAAALPANIYSNGASGVGATLTASANGALTVDGAAPVVGMRILVKNEAAAANNGIYTVTQAGSGSAPYVLTRAADFNQAGDIGPGVLVPVAAPTGSTAGGMNNDTVWISLTPAPFVVGTSSVSFSVAGGSGLSPIASGNILSNLSAGAAAPIGNSLSAILDGVLGNTQGAIVYRGATAWSELAPGVLGQALLTGGPGANPSWGNNSGAAGSMMLLQTKSGVSGAASVQFTNLPAGYDFVLMVDNFLASVNTTLSMQFGQGAGPTWDTSTNYYWQNFNATSGPGSGAAGPVGSIQLSSQMPVAGTNNGAVWNCTISGGSEVSANHMVSGSFQWFSHSFIGNTNNSYPLTGINIYPAAGTISGNFRLYGISRTQPNVNSVGSGLQQLAQALYNPGTAIDYGTAPTTSLTAIDSTNLAVTFSFPASGVVVVDMEMWCGMVNGSGNGQWGLLSGGSTVANSQRAVAFQSGVFSRISVSCKVSGTPGASATLQWAALGASGTAFHNYAGGNNGPAIMTVYAVNTNGLSANSDYYCDPSITKSVPSSGSLSTSGSTGVTTSLSYNPDRVTANFSTASSGTQTSAITVAYPGANFTLTVQAMLHVRIWNATQRWGVCAIDGSNNIFSPSLRDIASSNGSQQILQVEKQAGFGGTISTIQATWWQGWTFSGMPVWLRLQQTGGNFLFSLSQDGKNWVQLSSNAASNIGTPTKVGVFFADTNNDTAGNMSIFSWNLTTP